MSSDTENAPNPPTDLPSLQTKTKITSEKPPEVLRLKRGSLEVVGYTNDEPMCIKLKVTLPSGEVKSVCK